MKTMLIIILSLALVAAAFLTRPTKASFDTLVVSTPEDSKKEKQPTLKYQDKVLWAEMKREDERAYIGLFSHWIQIDDNRPVAAKSAMPADMLAVNNK